MEDEVEIKMISHRIKAEAAGVAGGETTRTRENMAIQALLMAVLLWNSNGCSRQRVPTLGTVQAFPVAVAIAVETNVPVELHAIGQVKAIATATVRSRVDGILEKAYFQAGDEVAKGDLIYSIDPRRFQVALDEAKAVLERDRAMARCEKIRASWNAELLQEGIILRSNCDQCLHNTHALAVAVATDEAAVDGAQIQRSFCDIHSPITGRTCIISVNGCVSVKKHDVLVTINQMKPIYVDFSVPQKELSRIRSCLAVAGKLPVKASVSGCDQILSGSELTNVNYSAIGDGGMAILRAIFPNKDEVLLPGGHVNIVLTLTNLTKAVIVPSKSVLGGQPEKYVFVVMPNSTVEARPVQVSRQMGSETVLGKGIESGEQIVTSDQTRLAPGMKIRIQNPISIANNANHGSSENPVPDRLQ